MFAFFGDYIKLLAGCWLSPPLPHFPPLHLPPIPPATPSASLSVQGTGTFLVLPFFVFDDYIKLLAVGCSLPCPFPSPPPFPPSISPPPNLHLPLRLPLGPRYWYILVLPLLSLMSTSTCRLLSKSDSIWQLPFKAAWCKAENLRAKQEQNFNSK